MDISWQFMFDLTTLPVRQKILIGLTVTVGLFLIVCSAFSLIKENILNQLILFYSIGIPSFLLMFDTVIDLNSKTVFSIWLVVATLTFIIGLITYNNDKFLIQRSAAFDPTSGVNSLIVKHSTSSLKTLLLFLVVYWMLNKPRNRRGLFIINTFKQTSWYHDEAQRKITGLDVVINFILYAVIFAAGVFGY